MNTISLIPSMENSIPLPLTKGSKLANFKLLNPKTLINEKTLEKVRLIAKFTLDLLVGVTLFWTNPSLFAIGYLNGIILDVQIEKSLIKIHNILKTQTSGALGLIGLASILSLPVTLAAGSILWSASLGSSMSLKSNKEFNLRV